MARIRKLAALVVGTVVLFGCSAGGGDSASITTDPSATSASSAPSAVSAPRASGVTTFTASTTTSSTATPLTTTTVPPQPPSLQVTDPTVGHIITTRVYTFRGETVPGAVVAVGKNYADVDDTGEWRLDLIMSPGSSATTVIATDPTSLLSTTVRVQLRYEPDLDLTIGGIDGARCGTPYEEAMQALTDLLGEPSQIVTDPPIDAYRQRGSVNAEWSWSEGGFLAMFSEWSMCIMGETDEYLHFMGWEIEGDSASLRLGGIAPGSTVEEFMEQFETNDCDPYVPDGCVHLSKEPHEGVYWFSLAAGMLPSSIGGFANRPDPATAVILMLASRAPT